MLVSLAHIVARGRATAARGDGGEGERAGAGCGGSGVCNSNGQIVIAERFDRWIMTSNDTPRWESKPPPFHCVPQCNPLAPDATTLAPPALLCHHPSPSPAFLPLCASLRHVLPLPREGADVDMRLRHAYAAAFGIGLCAANHRRET